MWINWTCWAQLSWCFPRKQCFLSPHVVCACLCKSSLVWPLVHLPRSKSTNLTQSLLVRKVIFYSLPALLFCLLNYPRPQATAKSLLFGEAPSETPTEWNLGFMLRIMYQNFFPLHPPSLLFCKHFMIYVIEKRSGYQYQFHSHIQNLKYPTAWLAHTSLGKL